MAQFQAINPKVEVNGQTVLSVSNGLGALKGTGLKILADNGISNPVPEGWYSQQSWLNAFKQISEKVGPTTLTLIGKSIPENAQFPPEIDDIYKALAAIDVAFHLNHRLNGKLLFNTANGQMSEGIGHYHYKKVSDNKVEITCDNSYPCDFDKGIIQTMTAKFRPKGAIVKIEHDESKGCRKKGASNCTYTISW